MRVLQIRILGTAAERITWPCWWVMWSSGVFSLQHWRGGLWGGVCVYVYTQREGNSKELQMNKTYWMSLYLLWITTKFCVQNTTKEQWDWVNNSPFEKNQNVTSLLSYCLLLNYEWFTSKKCFLYLNKLQRFSQNFSVDNSDTKASINSNQF